jgi:hypothetical protein
MESSLFLAKIMGVMFAVLGFAILFNTKFYMKGLDAVFKNAGLMYITGFMILVMGIILVLVHNVWSYEWTVIITVMAWGTFLKGLVFMIFPEVMINVGKKMITKGWLTLGGVLGLLIGLCLICKGFELCPLF